MSDIPRSEYPRPQFVRDEWLCLNGEWQFEIDQGDSGLQRGLLVRELQGRIIVPFCPESELSGIHNRDFMSAVWYRRTVDIPADWAGKRILLHIQACDYDSAVWVNGAEAGRHRGGFSPFSCDLHGIAEAGQAITIVIRARDNGQQPQPRGKQTRDYWQQRRHVHAHNRHLANRLAGARARYLPAPPPRHARPGQCELPPRAAHKRQRPGIAPARHLVRCRRRDRQR